MDHYHFSIFIILLFSIATVVHSGRRRGTAGLESGKIYDITHRYVEELPKFGSKNGMGQFLKQTQSIKNGSIVNEANISLTTHSGTHVDAPSHFYQSYYEAGYDVDSLDLKVLNGPALLIDVPRNSNITAEVMKSLNIPKEIHRVLFRTSNTDRKLMYEKEFTSNFTGFMAEGAKWLVENTKIKLVGLDYLSVAAYVDAAPTHLHFLKSRKIILVEGLKLEDIKTGLYNLHCLPLRLHGADGSPTRCILIE
ncbi:Cyclase family protein [Euphorbia peplus]|nr:Cyclase family protein [Euphorbia peplus]